LLAAPHGTAGGSSRPSPPCEGQQLGNGGGGCCDPDCGPSLIPETQYESIEACSAERTGAPWGDNATVLACPEPGQSLVGDTLGDPAAIPEPAFATEALLTGPADEGLGYRAAGQALASAALLPESEPILAEAPAHQQVSSHPVVEVSHNVSACVGR
jgi:hypothetical protein